MRSWSRAPLHGFFAHVAEPAAGKFEFHPYWLDASVREWLAWHAEAFGVLLPLGLAGFFFLRKQRLLFGLLAGGGILVRDLFRYSPGWNIVKFSMVAQVALAVLAASVLTAAVSRPRWRAAGFVGLGLATFFGFAWPLALATHPPPRAGDCVPPPPAGADADAIEYLRAHVRAGEGVFRSEHPDLYALAGGLPQTSWDWGTQGFGFSESLYEARRAMLAHPDRPRGLRSAGLPRWLVLGPHDGAVMSAAKRRVDAGTATLVATFPPAEHRQARRGLDPRKGGRAEGENPSRSSALPNSLSQSEILDVPDATLSRRSFTWWPPGICTTAVSPCCCTGKVSRGPRGHRRESAGRSRCAARVGCESTRINPA